MTPSILEPINLYSKHVKKTYGERIQKITIDAGFSCPNRDGTVGTGGCTYCNNESFSPGDRKLSISKQIADGKEWHSKRYRKVTKYIAYFQSYSNTYDTLENLKIRYEEALSQEGVIGLSIGTRPDCIDEEKLDYLEELAKTYDITIEYGLESIHDSTLRSINRGHGFAEFDNAMKMTVNRGIKICVHMILGLPNETKSQMLESASALSNYKIDYIKIHQLHIVKKTKMASDYLKCNFKLLDKNSYFEILKEFIERLSPDIVIQRMFGEAPKDLVIAGEFDVQLGPLNRQFMEYLIANESFQGKNFHRS